jgi:hypothetical protein
MTMDIFWLINLTKVTNLTISQIRHLVKLDFKVPPSQIGKWPKLIKPPIILNQLG